jgi:hypothetical protein
MTSRNRCSWRWFRPRQLITPYSKARSSNSSSAVLPPLPPRSSRSGGHFVPVALLALLAPLALLPLLGPLRLLGLLRLLAPLVLLAPLRLLGLLLLLDLLDLLGLLVLLPLFPRPGPLDPPGLFHPAVLPGLFHKVAGTAGCIRTTTRRSRRGNHLHAPNVLPGPRRHWPALSPPALRLPAQLPRAQPTDRIRCRENPTASVVSVCWTPAPPLLLTVADIAPWMSGELSTGERTTTQLITLRKHFFPECRRYFPVHGSALPAIGVNDVMAASRNV